MCLCPWDIFYRQVGGKTGPEIVDRYTKIIKTVSKCEACVKSKPADLNTIDPDIVCSSFCQECWTSKQVCEDCKSKGRNTIYAQLELCFQCLDKGIVCRKAVVQLWHWTASVGTDFY